MRNNTIYSKKYNIIIIIKYETRHINGSKERCLLGQTCRLCFVLISGNNNSFFFFFFFYDFFPLINSVLLNFWCVWILFYRNNSQCVVSQLWPEYDFSLHFHTHNFAIFSDNCWQYFLACQVDNNRVIASVSLCLTPHILKQLEWWPLLSPQYGVEQ